MPSWMLRWWSNSQPARRSVQRWFFDQYLSSRNKKILLGLRLVLEFLIFGAVIGEILLVIPVAEYFGIAYTQATQLQMTAEAQIATQIAEKEREFEGLVSPTSPALTPTPDVPRIASGTIWYDMPFAMEGKSPSAMGNVGGQEFTVVGYWGCMDDKGDVRLALNQFSVRVRVPGEPGEWWLLPKALPYTDQELQAALLGAYNYSGQQACQ